MSFDLLINNAKQVVTCAGYYPKFKRNIKNLCVIENGYVMIKEGVIVDVGKCPPKYYAEKVIDASGKVVMPGFVDCHTHLVHAGFREDEFIQKVKGKSYLEILAFGGGILRTVEATRKASKDELKKNATKILDQMLRHGTTTIEAKTGYGLDLETEVKCLEVMKELNTSHPIDIVSTFLGAHAFPKEYKGKEEQYVNKVIEMLSQIRGAEFCDVFCEKGAFSKKQASKILQKAKQSGFKLKMHADELTSFHGAELAAELGCVSADHLDMISMKGIRMLADKGVIGVLLPGVPYHLMTEKYAPANRMIKNKMIVALATDYNPGSCPTKSMQAIIELAVRKMKMGIEEAINAATVNSAYAIGLKDRGRIMRNYKADVIILDIPDYRHLAYEFGTNKVEKVIKNGKIVVDNTKI